MDWLYFIRFHFDMPRMWVFRIHLLKSDQLPFISSVKHMNKTTKWIPLYDIAMFVYTTSTPSSSIQHPCYNTCRENLILYSQHQQLLLEGDFYENVFSINRNGPSLLIVVSESWTSDSMDIIIITNNIILHISRQDTTLIFTDYHHTLST